jgi:ubiquinone biosynthesis monooxygenase Coq7
MAEHLARLPLQDARSRCILEIMQREETGHAQAAQAAGAAELPAPLRTLMGLSSKLMTRSAYYV